MPELGKALVILGVAIAVVGAIIWLAPFRIGRLPGDLVWQKGRFTFSFPIVTCILLSLLLTVVFWLFRR